MAKVQIDEELLREAMDAVDRAAADEWDRTGTSPVYQLYDAVGFKLHIALGGCGMTITSEPEPAPEELTEDERDALDDVVADYAFYMRQSCGDNLQPGMPMAAEGRAIKLAESALRKILGDEFGAQTKKEP
jgi:hypothetical protein